MYHSEKSYKIEQLCVGIKNQINRLSPPEKIYHYTSAHGLLGIFQSGTIWATNYTYLNDRSEVKYPSELIQGVIQTEIHNTKDIKKQKFLVHLEESVISKIMISTLYVTSFSEKKDLLSQWRAYCPKEGGFCIGFNSNMFSPKSIEFSLSSVIYDKEIQKEIIRNRIELFYKFYPQIEKILDDAEIEDALNPFYEGISDIILNDVFFFKNPSFREENEVRALHLIKNSKNEIDKVNFYENKNIIVPYIELLHGREDGKLPICEIIVSPSMNQDQLMKVLPLLSYKYNMDIKISMYSSQTPLRNR